MIEVYHDKNPQFGLAQARVWPDDFELVATVDDDDLEVAFALTNSDASWWQNNTRIVRCLKRYGARPTSVGDVFVNPDDEQAFLVMAVGYKVIGTTDKKIPIPPSEW